MADTHTNIDEHRDDVASKIGMWLFIFTELLLFGGLFIVYAVLRFKYSTAFHIAAEELDVTIGAINTVILLISSATIAMSITAIQRSDKLKALLLSGTTIILAFVFLVNKYFEWKTKFSHGLYPKSEKLFELGQGDTLFYGLYFSMTGLHALHIIVGIIVLAVMFAKIAKNKIHATNYVQLENGGLYWHLVDIIWIFLFPLFYLIA